MEEKKEEKKEEAVNWQAKAEELDECKKKAQEYLDGWKRAMADYANREKEINKEREALAGFFQDSIILEFLPVLDNLKTALNNVGSETPYSKGIEQVVRQFEGILNKFGVQKIELLDKEFDPAVAEAAERQGEGNKVVKVVADGYRKNDRVIRPARVIVG